MSSSQVLQEVLVVKREAMLFKTKFHVERFGGTAIFPYDLTKRKTFISSLSTGEG